MKLERALGLGSTAGMGAMLVACSSSSAGTSGRDASSDSHVSMTDARRDAVMDAHALMDSYVRTDAVSTHHADAHADVSPPPDASPHADGGHDAARPDAGDGGTARANGTLGPWQSLTAMPVPRANHCSVTASGYLVVIGGNYESDGSFVDLDAVHVAKLSADGSIGTWSQAGTAPSPVSGCTATASGSTIYLVDGIYDDTSDQGQAYSAELSPTGELGTWTSLGALPDGQDAFSSGAWVATDSAATLYVIDPAPTATLALVVPTEPSFGSWTEDSWLPGFLGRPEYAFTGAYVYAMGGYLSNDAGNPSVAAVSGAPVTADGGVGAAFTTTALPMPITFGCGVAVDDWVFVVGGKSAVFASGQATTLSAEVGADGQLGAWTSQAALPQGRTDMAMTLAGDFLYVTGGGYMGPGLDTVFAARVRF